MLLKIRLQKARFVVLILAEPAADAAQAVIENAQHYVLERKTWFAKKVFPETVDIDVTTTLLVTDTVSQGRIQSLRVPKLCCYKNENVCVPD